MPYGDNEPAPLFDALTRISSLKNAYLTFESSVTFFKKTGSLIYLENYRQKFVKVKQRAKETIISQEHQAEFERVSMNIFK